MRPSAVWLHAGRRVLCLVNCQLATLLGRDSSPSSRNDGSWRWLRRASGYRLRVPALHELALGGPSGRVVRGRFAENRGAATRPKRAPYMRRFWRSWTAGARRTTGCGAIFLGRAINAFDLLGALGYNDDVKIAIKRDGPSESRPFFCTPSRSPVELPLILACAAATSRSMPSPRCNRPWRSK